MKNSENLVNHNSTDTNNTVQNDQNRIGNDVTSDYDDDNIPEIDTPKITHPDNLVITSIEDQNGINFHQL